LLITKQKLFILIANWHFIDYYTHLQEPLYAPLLTRISIYIFHFITSISYFISNVLLKTFLLHLLISKP